MTMQDISRRSADCNTGHKIQLASTVGAPQPAGGYVLMADSVLIADYYSRHQISFVLFTTLSIAVASSSLRLKGRQGEAQ